MTKEIWKLIPDFPGYEVSTLGRVRSFMSGEWRVLKAGRNSRGYWGVGLSGDGGRVYGAVHRLVMLAFVGPCPDNFEVCHNDGNQDNNRLDNLRYDTRAANAHDARIHGAYGKLNSDQVEQIRIKYQNGCRSMALAQEYNLTQSAIFRIIWGDSYSHVGGPIKEPHRKADGKTSDKRVKPLESRPLKKRKRKLRLPTVRCCRDCGAELNETNLIKERDQLCKGCKFARYFSPE